MDAGEVVDVVSDRHLQIQQLRAGDGWHAIDTADQRRVAVVLDRRRRGAVITQPVHADVGDRRGLILEADAVLAAPAWAFVRTALHVDVARRAGLAELADRDRSEEHTSELQSLMRNSYAVFCLKK